MIIGADGGALAVSDERLKAGVHKVTERLLGKITQTVSSNYYRIYSHQGIGESRIRWGDRVENRVSPLKKGYMKLWTPIELSRHPVDVYLGLSQILPGSAMTSHIMICDDVWQNVSQIFPFLRRSGDRRKKRNLTDNKSSNMNSIASLRRSDDRRKNEDASKSDKQSGKVNSNSAGRFPPKYIGFIYDLAFLKHPEAYPESYDALRVQTADLARRADRIITISEATKKDIMETYGTKPERITVAYPGVDGIFSARGSVHRHKNPYFLSVGALKRQKNIPLLLESFRKFLDSGVKRADLILVGGDFWPDPEIAETIRRLRLSEYIIMPGVVKDNELAGYYRGATAFVSPSLREGFGLPVAEAMACSCPVIASNSGSYTEIIRDAGILVPPDKPDGFSEAMGKIITDPEFARKIGTQGKTRSEMFTWESFARKVTGVINDSV